MSRHHYIALFVVRMAFQKIPKHLTIWIVGFAKMIPSLLLPFSLNLVCIISPLDLVFLTGSSSFSQLHDSKRWPGNLVTNTRCSWMAHLESVLSVSSFSFSWSLMIAMLACLLLSCLHLKRTPKQAMPHTTDCSFEMVESTNRN